MQKTEWRSGKYLCYVLNFKTKNVKKLCFIFEQPSTYFNL